MEKPFKTKLGLVLVQCTKCDEGLLHEGCGQGGEGKARRQTFPTIVPEKSTVIPLARPVPWPVVANAATDSLPVMVLLAHFVSPQ